jgi:recombinational DNA repair protein (RecF pathway)
MVETLRLLAAGDPRQCQALTLAALWRMLAVLGYVPALDHCIECSEALTAAPLDFSPGHGGPLCAKCRPPAGTLHLSAKAAQAIGFLLAATWDEVRRVRLTPATAAQIRAVLAARVEELAGRKLASLRHV